MLYSPSQSTDCCSYGSWEPEYAIYQNIDINGTSGWDQYQCSRTDIGN